MATLHDFVPPLLRRRAVRFTTEWAREEGRIQVTLPSDYKSFLDEFEPVVDDFVWVLHPSPDNKNLDLASQLEIKIGALRTLRASDPTDVPYSLFSEPGGLLPWGLSDNGDTCYWSTLEPDPDRWTVVVNESRGPEWYSFPGKVTDFVCALLSREIHIPFFPDDFPSTA